MTARIRLAEGEADLAEVRRLCHAYRALLQERTAGDPGVLDGNYGAEAFGTLMDDLPRLHARPQGAILVAELDGRIVGCAMTHALATGVAEIKRLYVDPAARGRGVARRLCEAAVAQARADGYRALKLDTVTHLTEAIALYRSMGFVPCPPYREVAEAARPHLQFYELAL